MYITRDEFGLSKQSVSYYEIMAENLSNIAGRIQKQNRPGTGTVFTWPSARRINHAVTPSAALRGRGQAAADPQARRFECANWRRQNFTPCRRRCRRCVPRWRQCRLPMRVGQIVADALEENGARQALAAPRQPSGGPTE